MAVDRTDIETGRLLSAVVTWPEAQLTEHGTAGSVAPAVPTLPFKFNGAGTPATLFAQWRGFPLGAGLGDRYPASRARAADQ